MPSSARRFPLLGGLQAPSDVGRMTDEELADLAAEMREAIIDTVSQTGGHLGASLGTVELTIALHAELDSPARPDRLGRRPPGLRPQAPHRAPRRLPDPAPVRRHQRLPAPRRERARRHGRRPRQHLDQLRHRARRGRGATGRRDGHVVCVIGDGALTGGMAYEGLNQAGAPEVADHGRAQRQRHEHLRERRRALEALPARARRPDAHQGARGARARPGAAARARASWAGTIRDATKSLWFDGRGALRGARLRLPRARSTATTSARCAARCARRSRWTARSLIHVKTVKGKGYAPAEADGEAMHGATPFVARERQGGARSSSGPPNYTEVFGHALVAEAERDPRVVGITAAMLKGTGMQHMMSAASRSAPTTSASPSSTPSCSPAAWRSTAIRPVCAIYSTFLQRAFDPIVHDVAIQDLPVVFAIDRGGLVGDDGPTHHGVFDLAYLRSIPGLTVMAPDGRGRAGGHAPHGPADRRPGRPALPARRRPRRGAPRAARSPVEIGRARGRAGRGRRAGRLRLRRVARRRRRRPAPRTHSARARRSSTPASASRSTPPLIRQLAEPPRAAGDDRGPRRRWPASAARCSRCSTDSPVRVLRLGMPGPLRRPRQARAAARRRRAHARARRAHGPRPARAVAQLIAEG